MEDFIFLEHLIIIECEHRVFDAFVTVRHFNVYLRVKWLLFNAQLANDVTLVAVGALYALSIHLQIVLLFYKVLLYRSLIYFENGKRLPQRMHGERVHLLMQSIVLLSIRS